MNNNWLKYLVAIAAIMIAGSAAFFSVTGLGVLFSGAAVAVMIMAGSLEFAKLVTATYLKQEWDTIKGINKWYLTSAVVILMLITSAGIFGYLSNAFQQQNLKLDQVQREIQVWQNKIEYSNQQIATLQGQQKDLTSTQSTLITKGNVNSRLLKSVDNRDKQSAAINKKINSLQDSIVTYNSKINDVKNNNIGIEREVGGFRFVAEAFGVELKTVVKFFIILIVIVFDPLAVALVISFNQLVMVKKKDEETEPAELKDFVDETARLHLSEDDIKKLEEVLLNPPSPNEELKKAAEDYKEQVKQKPWSNLPDDTWDRMQKIEEQREAIHGPLLPEDEPTGALANSEVRDDIRKWQDRALEELDSYFKNTPKEEIERFSNEVTKLEREPFGEMMIKEEYSRMDIIGQNGNEGLHYDNEEETSTIKEEEITELLNEVQSETFNEEPTSLNEDEKKK
jgi:hypothetical protein